MGLLYLCAFNKGPKRGMRAQTKARCILGAFALAAGSDLLH